MEAAFFIISCSVSHFHSHIQTAISLLDTYKGKEPFAVFIKKFFAANKKYGSKDRKAIAHYCYCTFRWGKAWAGKATEDKLLAGVWLCHSQTPPIISELRPAWIDALMAKGLHPETITYRQKLEIIGQKAFGSVFPWITDLSEGIDGDAFTQSFFIQPDLFLRTRPGKMNRVKQQLDNAGILATRIGEDSLALGNSSNLEKTILIDTDAVIQDLSSQQIARFYHQVPRQEMAAVWDACAASGGKSILLYDYIPTIKLTVSDIRASVLKNLEMRFHSAGIKGFRSFVADLSNPGRAIPNDTYSFIIADVPCSGSGTWSRTPEQLCVFEEERLLEYASLQKKIISRLIPALKPGGYFLYITCSVFRQENEEQVQYLSDNFPLQCVKKETIIGYDKKADTMFAALFINSGS